MCGTITYWQDPDGMWLGYWNDYPDYQTEGHSFDDLKRMLISLRGDIREMIADGTMAESTKNVGELAYAWERLNLICDAIESADPELKQKSEVRSNRMLARQERAFARIMKRPNSKAYRDYVLVP